MYEITLYRILFVYAPWDAVCEERDKIAKDDIRIYASDFNVRIDTDKQS